LRKRRKTLDPFRFLLIALVGWMNQELQLAISPSGSSPLRFSGNIDIEVAMVV
jgi:hypothetical protein